MTIAAFAEPVVLEVYGAPQPQGNKTGFVAGGRVVMVEGRRPSSREAFKSWRQAVEQAGRDWQTEHNAPLLDEPCKLTLRFRLQKPKSATKKRIWPDSRPDVDKLTRAVMDAITDVLITNDSRVCELVVRKTYAVDVPPGCTITLEVLD